MSNYAARNSEGHHRVLDDDPAPIAHLKREHHKFRVLVDRVNGAATPQAKQVEAEALHKLLASHIALEEELFYPAVRDKGLVGEVNEGLVEHDIQRFLSAQIQAMDIEDELYGTRLGVLGEMLVHHIDEEDDDLFQDARRKQVDFKRLDDAMEAREHQLKAEYARTGQMSTPELDEQVRERNAV